MKNKIGIIGGGQLGRMLSLAAKPLGFEVHILDPKENCPASQVADKHTVGDFKDKEAVLDFASDMDFITYEIESANTEAIEEIYNKHHNNSKTRVIPYPKSLELVKDKFKQKDLFAKYHIPVSNYREIKSREDIVNFAHEHGYPFMLKARLNAYDGRGNAVINYASEIDNALIQLGANKSSSSHLEDTYLFDYSNLYLESFVDFDKELAIVAVRSVDNEMKFYPVVETVQEDNICNLAFAPALVTDTVIEEVKLIATKAAEALDYVSVFAIEFFLSKSGDVILNEIAPRVHNSGHFTIEACKTSQFEQHIRALTNLPLGSTELISPAVMVNILANKVAHLDIYGRDEVLALENTFLHIYGKDMCKPARKMGHITVLDQDLILALNKAKLAASKLKLHG